MALWDTLCVILRSKEGDRSVCPLIRLLTPNPFRLSQVLLLLLSRSGQPCPMPLPSLPALPAVVRTFSLS
jgi:hypothetical protein